MNDKQKEIDKCVQEEISARIAADHALDELKENELLAEVGKGSIKGIKENNLL